MLFYKAFLYIYYQFSFPKISPNRNAQKLFLNYSIFLKTFRRAFLRFRLWYRHSILEEKYLFAYYKCLHMNPDLKPI